MGAMYARTSYCWWGVDHAWVKPLSKLLTSRSDLFLSEKIFHMIACSHRSLISSGLVSFEETLVNKQSKQEVVSDYSFPHLLHKLVSVNTTTNTEEDKYQNRHYGEKTVARSWTTTIGTISDTNQVRVFFSVAGGCDMIVSLVC